MSKTINITEARKRLLSLPEELKNDEVVDIMRHGNVVLKIFRPMPEGSSGPDPFLILDKALEELSRKKIKKPVPQDLAVHYKRYLYEKKRS